MPNPHPPLTEDDLTAWSADLREREDALAAERAAFQAHMKAWMGRAERIVDRKADGLMDAFQIVRRAFPGGLNLRIEPWGPDAGMSIH